MSYLYAKIVEFLSRVMLTPETFVIMIVLLISGLALAVDYRLSLLLLFIGNIMGFVLFELLGITTTYFIMMIGLSIVLFSITIFISNNKEGMVR